MYIFAFCVILNKNLVIFSVVFDLLLVIVAPFLNAQQFALETVFLHHSIKSGHQFEGMCFIVAGDSIVL